jgi:hypothetical protein
MKNHPILLRAGAGLLALMAGFMLLAEQPVLAQSLDVGEKAPTFSLKTLEGKTIDTKNYRDKRATLMVFWASW